MKILFVSSTNLGLGLAMRCNLDGHDIRFISNSPAGGGIVKHKEPSEEWLPNIAVYDNNELAAEADSIRAHGYRVIGPSRWSSMIERDTGYRNQIITALGWPTNHLTKGTHLYISGWFNGAVFICSYTSLLYRRFMAGGVGPELPCTGMLSCFKPLTAKAYHTFLTPLEKVLKKVDHRGCVHIHAIVEEDNYCVKEIHTSFLHPLSLLLYENTNLSASKVMLSLLDETSKAIKPINDWASGVLLSVAPYPHGQVDASREFSMRGIVEGNLKHLWLGDVFLKEGQYNVSGQGLIGYVTARGDDEFECIRRMYRTVGNLRFPDIQYRNDIGRNSQQILQTLREPGWLAT